MARNQGSDHGEGQQPADFQTVLRAELQAIECSRALRHPEGNCQPEGGTEQSHEPDVIEAAHRARLVGLALSGGGIRSATFNLGVLQAFAELKLLHLFDYLSTVSGGGYIGSWLAARIRDSSGGPANRHVPGVTTKHEIPPTPLSKGEQGGFHTKPAENSTAQQDGSTRTGETPAGIFSVESELAAQPCEHGPAVEPQTVRFLRRYSNYLTPRIGLFGADTGTIVSTYTRNLILNLVILIGVLAAILILPRLLVWVSAVYHGAARAALLPALMFLVLGCLFIGKNVSALARRRDYQTTKAYAVYSSQMGIQLLIVLPLFLAAWFSICWLQFENGIEQSWWLYWALFAGCAYCVIWIIIWLVGFGIPKGLDWATLLLSAFGAGAVAGILILQLVRIVLVVPVEKSGQFLVEPWAWWINATWGPPMVVLIFALTGALQIGLMGRDFRDEIREWWSRLGGLMLIYVLVWAVFFWMTIYSPKYLLSTGPWLNPIKAALGSGWLLSTIGAIIAGKSPRTGPAESNHWMEILLKIAPYVFAIGLVACLAVGIHIVLPPLISPNEATFAQIFQAIQSDQWGDAYGWHWNWLNYALNWKLLVCLAGLFLIALLFSWRVDLNEFSTHLLYRNRLIRCYLGGSRNERDPDPFTGFDADDDFPLTELAPSQTIAANSGYSGPYSIINAALNLVGGKELGWQERKARPFIFTPLFCGYDVEDRRADTQPEKPALQSAAYRPTTQYASGEAESGSGGATPGITLGTAMAISGAAASPNMGFH